MKKNIRRWGINGEGITYAGRKAVFVEDAIPGETVDLEITQDCGSYLKGRVKTVLEPSPRRRHPLCPQWRTCGGCGLMHVDYKGQIRMKEAILREALKKYADYTGPIQPMIKNPSPLGYRNACKLPFGNSHGHIVTGMYQKESSQLVPMERCVIHTRALEHVRKEITKIIDQAGLRAADRNHPDGLRNLVLKDFDGRIHVVLVSGEMNIPQPVIDGILALDEVASVWQSIREASDPEHELFGSRMRHLGGEMKMTLQLDSLSLSLLPRSFFQLNTAQAKALYQTVVSWIQPGSRLIVEAYCGIGAMSLMAADHAREVVGIEWVEDAAACASENALINGCQNVRFVCGDAARQLQKLTQHQHVDTLIVDPPRSGLDRAMKEAILRDLPQTVIYVSCNPATLGKDLSVLQQAYAIEIVQPFDFFSQTPHVETAVLLRRKSAKEKL